MKVLVGSFPGHNELIVACLKEQLEPELYNQLEIQTMPVMGLAVADVLEALMRNISDADIFITYGAPVTEKVIAAGKKLKLIISTRGGPVNVDVAAADKRGIPISYAPGHNAEAVTDHAVALMLAEIRNIVRGHLAIKEGVWASGQRPQLVSSEMKGKTVGIVGLGNVGRLVAKKVQGFEVRLIVYDPFVSAEKVAEVGAEKVDFEVLLAEADFITLHIRLSESTYHMFGAEQFARMKPSAYLINTSRGPAIDEAALYEALKSKKIAGAALDVFEEEPMAPDHPLLTLPNITVTPHIAYLGFSRRRGASMAADEVKRLLIGEPLRYVVDAKQFMFEREMYDKIFKGRKIR